MFYTAANWTSDTQLAPELLMELQRLAVNQIYRCAGHFRDGPVFLEGATHQPPPSEQVRGLVDEMCQYVNWNWNVTPVHLSSARCGG